jgi:hypothetical protein
MTRRIRDMVSSFEVIDTPFLGSDHRELRRYLLPPASRVGTAEGACGQSGLTRIADLRASYQRG